MTTSPTTAPADGVNNAHFISPHLGEGAVITVYVFHFSPLRFNLSWGNTKGVLDYFPNSPDLCQRSFIFLPPVSSEANFSSLLWQKATHSEIAFLQNIPLFLCVLAASCSIDSQLQQREWFELVLCGGQKAFGLSIEDIPHALRWLYVLTWVTVGFALHWKSRWMLVSPISFISV